MKKGVIVVLTVMVGILSAACGRSGMSVAAEQTEYGMKMEEVCSYAVPDGWVQAEKYTTEDKIFYVREGHEEEDQPDNISVNIGENQYSTEEHMKFRDAILKQLTMQLSGRTGVQLFGEGTYTDQGYIMYVFTIEEDQGVVTKQYYIVDDYRYALIILTDFSGSEEAGQTAEKIADSFVWEDQREEK